MRRVLLIAALVTLVVGCGSSYVWRSKVPERMRTVAVPTFRNETDLTELGNVMTRQALREFQREGTFKIKRAGDAALEIQGVVKNVRAGSVAYNRRNNLSTSAYDFSAVVEVSVIDKCNGKVIVDNAPITASTTFTARQDIDTAERDASGRLADDFSRQLVDMVLGLKWEGKNK